MFSIYVFLVHFLKLCYLSNEKIYDVIERFFYRKSHAITGTLRAKVHTPDQLFQSCAINFCYALLYASYDNIVELNITGNS